MNLSRRDILLGTLFGTSMVGLRAIATGIPASVLLDPRKAFANGSCPSPQKAQFLVMSTSGAGDPLNVNTPGTYDDGHGNTYSDAIHADDATHSNPTMAKTQLTIGGLSWGAAAPWGTLPLDRTVFFHGMTNTPIHPKEPEVLKLMGATSSNDMLPSIIAAQLAPCLGTIQTAPVAVGNTAISFQGAPQPVIPPLALQATLTTPSGPLGQLQALRDDGLNQLYAIYRNGATPAQRAYIDSFATSQSQLRNINDSLLAMLSSIQDNSAASQIQAAVALIMMKVSPVITVQIPFGGDNHFDQSLSHEAGETVAGVGVIRGLLAALAQNNLQDAVTFMSLNVFGRTLATSNPVNAHGRNHNEAHHVSVIVGAPFKGSVIGGITHVNLTPSLVEYGCTGIDPATGAPSTSSSAITPVDTLGALAKTVLAGVGGDPMAVTAGSVVTAALA